MASTDEWQQRRSFEEFLIFSNEINPKHTYMINRETEVEFEPVKGKEGWFKIKEVTSKIIDNEKTK